MKNWTKEEKNHKIEFKDYKQLESLHEEIKKSIWRTDYHIQTVTGLMNDPNGFSFYNGKWHLFYQWFPFGAVHGMKHWYHTQSEDLVHFENVGVGLKPDTWYDNYGCFSGSAFTEDDLVYFTYTGNNRDENYTRHPYQLLAGMNPENRILKYEEPIITEHEDYTEHQRDPKIFKREEDGMYYILMGAQDKEEHGKFIMYRSKYIHTGWEFLGELKVRGYDHFGFMVECPDIEKIGDKYVLMFSPQGIEANGDSMQNKFNNVYLIGDLDFYYMEFIPDGEMQELDHGFDFYAAQCAHQDEIKDTAVLSAWFGVSDYTYPATDEQDWAGLLTMPRLLTIEDGKLMQRPVEGYRSLRQDSIFSVKNGNVQKDLMHAEMPRCCSIDVKNPKNKSVTLNLFTYGRGAGFQIDYNAATGVFSIDKSDMENQTNTEFGTERKIVLKDGLKHFEAFVDHSSVEIFINDGEYVMSSRIFPGRMENMIRLAGSDIDIEVYPMTNSVEDDFKM